MSRKKKPAPEPGPLCTCLYCKKTFESKRTGRIPFYCSDKCRVYANRQVQAAERRAAREETIRVRALMLLPTVAANDARSGSPPGDDQARAHAHHRPPPPPGRILHTSTSGTQHNLGDNCLGYGAQTVIYVHEETLPAEGQR